MRFIKRLLSSLLSVEPKERLKLFFLSLAYFCIIVSYAITRELRDSIFSSIVGSEYIWVARIIGWIVFIVPLFLYAKMVDRFRRYQLLCILSTFYGIGSLIFAYFLGDPGIGLLNTSLNSHRLFGWIFYFFIEGYQPFVVSVFWAFANSITDQEAAKKNYGLMVAGSKIGGMLGALFSIAVLNWSIHQLSRAQDVVNHQILLIVSAIMSLAVPFVIIMLMKKVPGRYLHGYEAVYKVEKERIKKGTSDTGVWSGLKMLVNTPYVFGMFSIIFFYETINTVLGYQRVRAAHAGSTTISEMSTFLYEAVFFVHFFGFLISVFGTRTLIDKLGEKTCLMLIPAINFLVLMYVMYSYTPFAFIVASVVTKAVHYALSYPVRESLYIPTIKEIKFKSKSWIDTFGSKFARATGSTFNGAVSNIGAALFFPVHIVFLGAVTGVWLVVAYFLGKRYETAIASKEVIGWSKEMEQATGEPVGSQSQGQQ